MECSETDCEETAAIRLHVPWADTRVVCAAHARSVARKDGVVAEPLSDADDQLP